MACSWASYRRDRVNIAVSEWDWVTKIESSPETHNLRTREPTNATDCGRRPVNANDILRVSLLLKTYQSFTPLYQLPTLLSSTSQLASATVQFTWWKMQVHAITDYQAAAYPTYTYGCEQIFAWAKKCLWDSHTTTDDSQPRAPR
jgi:hypothetical protein